jgi:hypothetical protein
MVPCLKKSNKIWLNQWLNRINIKELQKFSHISSITVPYDDFTVTVPYYMLFYRFLMFIVYLYVGIRQSQGNGTVTAE